VLDGGERSTSRPDRFTPGKIRGILSLGGWVDSRANTDVSEKRIMLIYSAFRK
jgi:hypothetical protein